MPVMNKMRDSMPVVFAVLAGIFLLMIIFEWGGQGRIFSSGADAETFGVVDGYKITKKMWEDNLQATTAQLKEKSKHELGDAEQQQAEDQAWDRAVQQALINQSIERMHITVTDQEVRDEVFENPPADIRRQFTDSVGRFHAEDYVKALRDPRNDSLVRIMETGLRDQIRIRKWQEVMSSYVQVTDAELMDRFQIENAKAVVQVVKIMPGPQETQEAAKQVTDNDLQAYYDAHKNMFKVPESRTFKFVPFRLQATPRDTAMAMESAETVKRRLQQTPADQLDSATSELLADYAPNADPKTSGRQTLASDDAMNDQLASAKPGDAVVTTMGGKLAVVRVTSVSDTGMPAIHARHIFFDASTPQAIDSVKAIAQQVYQQLQGGADFGELAHKYSSDYRTVNKGGDMGWIVMAKIPPDVAPQVNSAELNKPIPPFVTRAGVDIMEVLGRGRRSMSGIVIPLDIKPSSQSQRLLQQQATAFEQQADKKGFDEAAKDAGYRVISDAPPASRKGAPIFSSPSVVNWLFSAKKGEISTPFKLPNLGATIVAQLTGIQEAGPQPFDQVKTRIQQTLVQRKAVDLMASKAKQAQAAIASTGDIDNAAKVTGDSSLKPLSLRMGPAESVSGIPSAEYVVNNAAFSMKPGQVSNLLKGESGYYVVRLVEMNPASEEMLKGQKESLRGSLLQEKRQRFFTNWLDNRKQNAEIIDYRQHH